MTTPNRPPLIPSLHIQQMNTPTTATYPSVEEADVFKDYKSHGLDRVLTHNDLVKVTELLTGIQQIAQQAAVTDDALTVVGLIGSIRAKAMIAEVYIDTTLPLKK